MSHDKPSRRRLLGLPEKKGRRFSLDAFYESREGAPPQELPAESAVDEELVGVEVETTRVGTPELAPGYRPDRDRPKPVAAPTAPPTTMATGSLDVPLPDLQDAQLDPATLDQLFFDIAAECELIAVLLKGGARQRAGEQSVPLAEARRQLAHGPAVGVQLRYRYRGSEWWDTLLRTRSGVRLVRIEHRLEV